LLLAAAALVAVRKLGITGPLTHSGADHTIIAIRDQVLTL
jgi:hypothetical protein